MIRLQCLVVAFTITLSVPCHAQLVRLTPGERLLAGQSRTSLDGRFTLTMQSDGNLVWRYGERVIWAANPGDSKEPECVMQSDGNLVIYGFRKGKRQAVWASNT